MGGAPGVWRGWSAATGHSVSILSRVRAGISLPEVGEDCLQLEWESALCHQFSGLRMLCLLCPDDVVLLALNDSDLEVTERMV